MAASEISEIEFESWLARASDLRFLAPINFGGGGGEVSIVPLAHFSGYIEARLIGQVNGTALLFCQFLAGPEQISFNCRRPHNWPKHTQFGHMMPTPTGNGRIAVLASAAHSAHFPFPVRHPAAASSKVPPIPTIFGGQNHGPINRAPMYFVKGSLGATSLVCTDMSKKSKDRLRDSTL